MHLINALKLTKAFKVLSKWRTFAKSGHTVGWFNEQSISLRCLTTNDLNTMIGNGDRNVQSGRKNDKSMTESFLLHAKF